MNVSEQFERHFNPERFKDNGSRTTAYDEVESEQRKARIFIVDDSAPWEVPKSITAHGEM